MNRKYLLSRLAGCLALVTTWASYADAISPVVVFTEYSSTELTVTLDGAAFGSVALEAPNHWVLKLPGEQNPSSVAFSGFGFWLEPGSTADHQFGNLLSFGGGRAGNTLDIFSDIDITERGGPKYPDGTVLPNEFTFKYPDGSVLALSPQFIDLGDQSAANVPDASSTFALMVLAVVPMVGCLRLGKWANSVGVGMAS